ncbi:MAG TPA: MFS transporter [Mycobacteriales bacterium]|nr:MFS transporter [Mycobacteriales bacterium]
MTPTRVGADRQAETLVEEVASTREALRGAARRTLGVTGEPDADRLGPILRENGVTLYPLVVLGVLAIVDTFQGYAFRVLAPEISRTLGISAGAFAGLLSLEFLAAGVAPLLLAGMVRNRPRRALLSVLTAAAWALATLVTGFAIATSGLLLVLLADGFTSGSVGALHQPLLMDSYPPPARVRVLSFYNALAVGGTVFAPLTVALLVGPFGLTWRGVFIVMGCLCVAVLPIGYRLRDPGFGRWDTEALRRSVHTLHGESDRLTEQDVELGYFEIFRRLLLIPTVKRLLVAYAVVGVLLIPLQTYLSFYLEQDLGLSATHRALFFAYLSAAGIVALVLYGKRGEEMFRRSPRRVIEVSGLQLGLGVVLIVAAIGSPYRPLAILLFGVASALIAALTPAFAITLLSIVPAQTRPHAQALLTISAAGVGGLAGVLLLGSVQDEYGVAGALVSLLVPGVLGSLLLHSAGKTVQTDMDRMIDEVLEDEEIKRITRAGGHLPLLSCKGIDFSYGQLQVLFDVDFTVDDGEMVALLGVNGAGKSTLLKVMSGVGLPSAGTVRFRGQDITYLDAERRARLGITQVPGGRAVFGPLTVVDNLRSFGYTLGRDKVALNQAIEKSFDTFPRLAERRNSNAATLSGGEQQMLGLSKALIMQPKLLVIDELSLGLAPVIVAQLLELVKKINQTGTAVVLVEQSVNIALNLVQHAYFMEKGEMRFDGRSEDLLARDDLLRAVFLEGAAKGQGT